MKYYLIAMALRDVGCRMSINRENNLNERKNLNIGSISDLITKSFSWKKTREGDPYWRSIFNKHFQNSLIQRFIIQRRLEFGVSSGLPTICDLIFY